MAFYLCTNLIIYPRICIILPIFYIKYCLTNLHIIHVAVEKKNENKYSFSQSETVKRQNLFHNKCIVCIKLLVYLNSVLLHCGYLKSFVVLHLIGWNIRVLRVEVNFQSVSISYYFNYTICLHIK